MNWPLLGSVALLLGMGLLSLWSYSTPRSGDALSSRFIKQMIFASAAIFLMFLALLPNYFTLRRLAYLLYILCIATLVALLLFGRVTRGSRGWFMAGPFMVQPAEFMKIALVFALARHLMYAKRLDTVRGLIIPILLAAIPTGLVLLQPDLGTSLIFFPAMLAMLFAAGARAKHLGVLILAALLAAPIAYQVGLKQYQRDRLRSFLFPDDVPKALVYQQSQSVKACASGGLTGRGIGESAVSYPFYIPDRHTDFPFSIVAQDLGFLGSSFILLLYALLFAQALRIAYLSREPFGRLLAVGLTMILAMQVFINIGMTIGVAPITGLTLPFVSYGGSSLVTCGLAAAILLNIGSRWIPTFD